MLAKVKTALRLTTAAHNDELTDMISAAYADLDLVGIPSSDLEDDPLVVRAVITYCRMNFGSPADYDRLKASYDEQKAQMLSATGYGIQEAE